MKYINTLIEDIYEAVGTEKALTELAAGSFSQELGLKLLERAQPRDKVPSLRLSQMGPVCERQLWASIHQPSAQEPFPAYTLIKFLYGDILESLVIALAKSSGHEVTGEQDAVTVDGITGHRDCVIDGCIVDVKSAATRSFQKIKSGNVAEDVFLQSYLDQLDGYLLGSRDDPLVRVKDRAYLLAIDKTLGHLCLYEHRLREQHIRDRIKSYKEIVGRTKPPTCSCGTLPDGKSGNIRLDVKASYSNYKYFCNPHLRTFLYKERDGVKPVYLTKVVKIPNVTEIDRHGKIVYNG